MEVDGDGGRAEAVGSFARVATGICLLDVGDVQPRPSSLYAEPLPAEVDAVRVLGPRHERARIGVDRTRDANGRSELNDQRRRILSLHVRRLRSCTEHTAVTRYSVYERSAFFRGFQIFCGSQSASHVSAGHAYTPVLAASLLVARCYQSKTWTWKRVRHTISV